MIGSLRGELLHIRELGSNAEWTVDCHGVGYRVTVPARAATTGEQVVIWAHTHVREDAFTLYGFETIDHRDCFETLIAAHGIGPTLAMGILSTLNPAALAATVAAKDSETLTSVPGVGKKTAERIVVELASKLDQFLGVPVEAVGSSPEPQGTALLVVDSLIGMGYHRDLAKRVAADLDDKLSLEEALRQALSAAVKAA